MKDLFLLPFPPALLSTTLISLLKWSFSPLSFDSDEVIFQVALALLRFKILKAFTFTEKPVRMRRKRGGLAAVSFILSSILDRLKVAKELFTGRDQLDSIFRVRGWTEVGNVHDVVLPHTQHH